MDNNDILKTVSLSEIYAKGKERYIKMCELLYPIRELLVSKGFNILDIDFIESPKYDIALMIKFTIIDGENFLMIHKNLNDSNLGISSDKVHSILQVFDNHDLKKVNAIMDEAIKLGYGVEDKVYNLSKTYLINANNSFLGIYCNNRKNDDALKNISIEIEYNNFNNKKNACIIKSGNDVMTKNLKKDKEINFFLENVKIDEKKLTKKYQK